MRKAPAKARTECCLTRRSGSRLSDTIARHLASAIQSGHFSPGDPLPREATAHELFHVSRASYREAVRILTAKGFAHARPKAGTRVSPKSEWQLLDPDVLLWSIDLEVNPTSFDDLLELRGIIEPSAASLASIRRNEGHLKQIGMAVEEMKQCWVESSRGLRANKEFHLTILEASCNPFLVTFSSSVAEIIERTIHRFQEYEGLCKVIFDYEMVHRAITERDSDSAREAMHALLSKLHGKYQPSITA